MSTSRHWQVLFCHCSNVLRPESTCESATVEKDKSKTAGEIHAHRCQHRVGKTAEEHLQCHLARKTVKLQSQSEFGEARHSLASPMFFNSSDTSDALTSTRLSSQIRKAYAMSSFQTSDKLSPNAVLLWPRPKTSPSSFLHASLVEPRICLPRFLHSWCI